MWRLASTRVALSCDGDTCVGLGNRELDADEVRWHGWLVMGARIVH